MIHHPSDWDLLFPGKTSLFWSLPSSLMPHLNYVALSMSESMLVWFGLLVLSEGFQSNMVESCDFFLFNKQLL